MQSDGRGQTVSIRQHRPGMSTGAGGVQYIA